MPNLNLENFSPILDKLFKAAISLVLASIAKLRYHDNDKKNSTKHQKFPVNAWTQSYYSTYEFKKSLWFKFLIKSQAHTSSWNKTERSIDEIWEMVYREKIY